MPKKTSQAPPLNQRVSSLRNKMLALQKERPCGVRKIWTEFTTWSAKSSTWLRKLTGGYMSFMG